MKDFHVKKPGAWFWKALSREEVAQQIGTGVIQPDWRILRDGESEIITVGEFLQRNEQSSAGGPVAGPSSEAAPQSTGTNLKGIGGWLILVTIGLVVSPIRIATILFSTYVPIFTGETWSLLTTPGSAAYNWAWKPILLFELFGNLIFLLLAVALLVLLFNHKRIFPMMMIGYYVANLLFVGLDFAIASGISVVASQADAGSIAELIKSIAVCAIWVPYFLISERVKQTFTE
jgi:uncharacterized protein DUF2569